MARYKTHQARQVKLIPISFTDQILPGIFAYALNEIVDRDIETRPFEARYKNDETGRLAYDATILLQIVLFDYYAGMISSRRLAEACKRNRPCGSGMEESSQENCRPIPNYCLAQLMKLK
jgi:transposase